MNLLELVIGNAGVAQVLETLAQCGMPATCGEHYLTSRNAHVLGCDDLVGGTVLDDAILVYARTVREGVRADHCLVGLHVDTGDRRDETACMRKFDRVDIGMRIELVLMHLDRHDDFLHGGIARSLAQAVDGALNLRGAVYHARKRKRRRHAQVVVAMHRDARRLRCPQRAP